MLHRAFFRIHDLVRRSLLESPALRLYRGTRMRICSFRDELLGSKAYPLVLPNRSGCRVRHCRTLTRNGEHVRSSNLMLSDRKIQFIRSFRHHLPLHRGTVPHPGKVQGDGCLQRDGKNWGYSGDVDRPPCYLLETRTARGHWPHRIFRWVPCTSASGNHGPSATQYFGRRPVPDGQKRQGILHLRVPFGLQKHLGPRSGYFSCP